MCLLFICLNYIQYNIITRTKYYKLVTAHENIYLKDIKFTIESKFYLATHIH